LYYTQPKYNKNVYKQRHVTECRAVDRAGWIELFTARVLCRAFYRVLEYSEGCASYSPAAVTQVKVVVRKAVYRRTPDS